MNEHAVATRPETQTDVQVAPHGTAIVTPEHIAAQLDAYGAWRRQVRDWIHSKLVRGVHYGTPPGCRSNDSSEWKARPSLYKAGAEFLCQLCCLQPAWTADRDTIEMMGDSKVLAYVCTLTATAEHNPMFPTWRRGEVAGEGRGAYEVGYKKMTRNAVVKMAQKSALVDAVIHTLGISDLFTQDIEDDEVPPKPRAAKQHDAPTAGTREQRTHAEKVKDVFARWSRAFPDSFKRGDAAGNGERFTTWAKQATKDDGDLSKAENWSDQAIENAHIVLDEIEGAAQ